MHPKLTKAITKAEAILTEMTADEEAANERARLAKLTKAQLIDELMMLKFKRSKRVKVEDLVYAVMCEPDCAALNYAMIATMVSTFAGSKTSTNNVRWYASKALEKGYDTVARASNEEFEQMVLA